MQLGNNCEYVLDLGNEVKRFSSEQELDLFLKTQIDEMGEAFSAIDKTFSVNPKEKTKKILEECAAHIKSVSKSVSKPKKDVIGNPEDFEMIEYIPESIGITEFISSYGLDSDWTQPITPKFDLKGWQKMAIDEYVEAFKKKGMSEEDAKIEAQNTVQSMIDTWPELTEIGNEVHAILEDLINGKEPRATPQLSETLRQSVIAQANMFIDGLKAKHGKNCEFYSEFAIQSKELDPNMQEILKKLGKNSLNGRIDLLVIDEWGRAHIYDYKVSRKIPGNWNETSNAIRREKDWWHSTKIRNATYQQAFYNVMLQQWGVNVASCNIVPIKLDLTYENAEAKATIKSIDKINFESIASSIPGTTAGAVYNNVSHIVPVASAIVESETFRRIKEMHHEYFPSVVRSEERASRDADYLKDEHNGFWWKVNESSAYRSKGKYCFREQELSGKNLVYADTKEQLFEKIDKYVEDVKKIRASELTDLANLVVEIINGNGDWKDISKNISDSKKYWIENQFKKYLVQKWNFIYDPELNRAGYFIFSDNAGHTEIIKVTNKAVFDENKLSMGTSILGNTTEDMYIDRKHTLSSSNGNLELMEVMLYLSENPEFFEKNPITEIRCINPWYAQETIVTGSQLVKNYRDLRRSNPKVKSKDISTNIFWDDHAAMIYLANSKLSLIGESLVQEINPEIEFTQDWINAEIKSLRGRYDKLSKTDSPDYTDPVWQAYLYLQRAQLALNGIRLQNEINIGNWRSGVSPTGLNISSAQLSPSANIRFFADVHDQYVAEVRQKIVKQGLAMQEAFKAFYEEHGQIRAIGGEANWFRDWFKQNPDGTLHKSFTLKEPSEIQGTKARKALEMFLDTMWHIRHPDASDEETQRAKEDLYGEYYQVPLTEAVMTRQLKESIREEGFFKGVWRSFKNKVKEVTTLADGVFAEDVALKQEFELNNARLYNKFELSNSQREKKLTEHGTGSFETDLESVFNQALVAYVKQEVSKKYVPIFNAMRAGLVYASQQGGNNLQDVITAFDKMVKSKFYGENIMDKNLQGIYKVLAVMKSAFSTLTLGLSVRSFLREILQGTWIGLSRSGVEVIDGVNMKTYIKGATHVIQEAHKNITNVSLLQQLNALYGMANYSLNNIPYMRKSNFLGIRNWSSDTLFLTASSPDFQHRMAILVAKMMGDGCWEAHSLDENGNLKYDMSKDERFKIYLSGDTSNEQYLYQKALYDAYLEEWNRIGYTKEDGTPLQANDPLPQAYPPKEGQRLKNHADLLYGHYDDESRSLLNDMFLGSLFMQYKTYVTAKMEQWTMKPGVYNTEHIKQQYDETTGEELWMITEYPEEDQTGIPSRRIVKKSEVKEGDLAQPYMTWQGDPMEGIAQGMWGFIKTIWNRDWTELDKMWKDPKRRADLILGLHDLIFMSVIALLLKLLFGKLIGEDDPAQVARSIRDEGWLTQTSYNILYGSVQDFPVWKVISSMSRDLNPPLWGSVERLVSSSAQVITGDASLAYAVTQNVGALREFQGYVKTLQDE